MTTKRILFILSGLIACTLVLAQPKRPSIQYGPWIQNVTGDGFTVVFKTAEPSLAFVTTVLLCTTRSARSSTRQ